MQEKPHGRDASRPDTKLLDALLDGDESAFDLLVQRYNRAMVRMAMAYVPSRAIAEEVAQEAWLAMLRGLSGFQGRSSLKTWLFGILLNRARTRGSQERRQITFTDLKASAGPAGRRREREWLRLRQRSSQLLAPAWGRSLLGLSPEDRALSGELRLCLERAIERLPAAQRAVIVLRDVEGWSSGEVCELLGITPENQRVRLHRARVRVRDALETYLDGE